MEATADKEIMVSVFCAAYNHAPYLANTLDSFVNQKTDFAFEVLVNDDCSTDNTAEIIREYAVRYPDIIVPIFQTENQFSKGIEFYDSVFFPRARGKYFAFCEGDDYWNDESKLQRQTDFLEAHPEYTACVHNTTMHYCDGGAPDEPYLPAGGGDRDVSFEAAVNGMGVARHTSAMFARREFMVNEPKFHYTAVSYGFSDQPRAIWLTMNGKVRFLDREMSVYRLNSNAAAWTAGIDGQYDKRIRFVTGEVEMLKDVLACADETQIPAVKQSLLEHEFELRYLQGKDRELVKPPYREIYKKKDMRFRMKQFIKRNLPFIQKAHRKNRGYGD